MTGWNLEFNSSLEIVIRIAINVWRIYALEGCPAETSVKDWSGSIIRRFGRRYNVRLGNDRGLGLRHCRLCKAAGQHAGG